MFNKKFFKTVLLFLACVGQAHANSPADIISTYVFVPNKDDSRVFSNFESYKIGHKLSLIKFTVAISEGDGDLSLIYNENKINPDFFQKLFLGLDPTLLSQKNVIIIELSGLITGPAIKYQIGYILFDIDANLNKPVNIRSGMTEGKYGQDERFRLIIENDSINVSDIIGK